MIRYRGLSDEATSPYRAVRIAACAAASPRQPVVRTLDATTRETFATVTLVFTVILVALVFEYINGFHDTANSIATVVSTKVLTPRQAVVLAALTNLLGALWGTAVAKTIASGLVNTHLVAMTSD